MWNIVCQSSSGTPWTSTRSSRPFSRARRCSRMREHRIEGSTTLYWSPTWYSAVGVNVSMKQFHTTMHSNLRERTVSGALGYAEVKRDVRYGVEPTVTDEDVCEAAADTVPLTISDRNLEGYESEEEDGEQRPQHAYVTMSALNGDKQVELRRTC